MQRNSEYKLLTKYNIDGLAVQFPFNVFRLSKRMCQQFILGYDSLKFYSVHYIAVRKHIIADHIRYIGKESNNLDEAEITGLHEDDYLEYLQDHEIVNSKEFLE